MKILNCLLTQLLLSVVWLSVASAQSITPRVCVEPSFGGLTAVFGYESSEPNPTTILVGPSNNLSPASANPIGPLHTVFYPGFQEGFAISFFPSEANPTLTWTLQGQSVSADWNTRLCSSQSDLAIAISDGVNVVMPGTTVSYTVTAQLAALDANQSVFATVSNTFPVQCSSVSWTCQGDAGSRCTAAGTGDIDDLVFLTPGAGVTYLASCAIAAAASGSLSNFAEISSEATDLAPFNNQAADLNAVVSSIFTINSASAVEGNSGAAPMRFTVIRTGGTGAGVGTQTVNVASAAGASATAGVDYVPLTSTLLSFAPGVNTRSVDVQVLGDTIDEPDETLNLILSSPSSGTGINNAIGVGSIEDDDPETSSTNIVSDLPDPSVRGESFAVSVAVSGTRSAPLGSVNISDGAASCNLTLAAANALRSTGSCSIASPTAGNKTLTANYLPASTAFAASAATATHEVRAAATRLAFSSAPVRGRINQPINYTVVLGVDAPGAGTPAGTIRLSSASTSCTITVPTSTPSCALQFAALGTQSISASFTPSDANFAASATAASANTLVFAQADLAVSKNDGVSSFSAGQLLIYSVILRNNGPDAAPRVRLQDLLPSALQNPSWSCASSGGAICPAAIGSGNIDATVTTMPANATLTYTLSANAATPAPPSISNSAEVFLPADNSIDDAVLSNQSQTDVNTRLVLFADGFERL